MKCDTAILKSEILDDQAVDYLKMSRSIALLRTLGRNHGSRDQNI